MKCTSGEFGELLQTIKSLKSPIILSDPIDGCELEKIDSFQNNTSLSTGSILIMKRGKCPFINKALYAIKQSASGLVIINDKDKLEAMTIPNNNNNNNININIPCVLITKSDGEYLLNLINNNQNIWMEISGGDYADKMINEEKTLRDNLNEDNNDYITAKKLGILLIKLGKEEEGEMYLEKANHIKNGLYMKENEIRNVYIILYILVG